METGIEKLYNKMQMILNEHRWIPEGLALIPALEEVQKWIAGISNISNDMKLDKAWYCISQGMNIEESINQIYNYVSNEERAFYISNEFRKIILSSSLLSSSIIAYIMGQVVCENRKCKHSETIITNALTFMTDFDIDNFEFLCSQCMEEIGKQQIINIDKAENTQKESLQYTLQICVSYGIFRTESAIYNEEMLYEGIHYIKTNLCDELLNYIDKVKQLLQYQH